MIHVSITGGETPDGGELIRLLAMHPDVELMSVQGTGLEGVQLTGHHHGLIGETSLCFSSSVDYSKCDVLFVCGDVPDEAELSKVRLAYPEMKIIMMDRPSAGSVPEGTVYGLPEINRKLLVRGATTAIVPESFASMALVALFPFAKHLLLNGDISIRIAAPAAILDTVCLKDVSKEIEEQLKEVQTSFNGHVVIEATSSEARRSGLMDMDFACTLSLQQMLDLYGIYDDHRFSFVTTSRVGVSEVAGTNKCIVSVGKGEPGRAALGVAADCRLRGAAGEALHVMNLMCGLHEKTGLSLKAIDFDRVEALS